MATASNIGEQINAFAEGVGTAMRTLKTEFTGDIDGGLISGSDSPSQTMNITENGTYNVTGKTTATVNVPTSSAHTITVGTVDANKQQFGILTKSINNTCNASSSTIQTYTQIYPTVKMTLNRSADPSCRYNQGTIIIDGVDTNETTIDDYNLTKDINVTFSTPTLIPYTPLTFTKGTISGTYLNENDELSVKTSGTLFYNFTVQNPNPYRVFFWFLDEYTDSEFNEYVAANSSETFNYQFPMNFVQVGDEIPMYIECYEDTDGDGTKNSTYSALLSYDSVLIEDDAIIVDEPDPL